MAANYPEIWLAAVIKLLKSFLAAPWLDSITEIAADVSVINGGALTEKNIIHVPTTMFAPDVLINNTTYPIDAQAYTDDTISLTLDKYQTKVTTLTDDETMGASYDKIKEVTTGHVEAITGSKYKKALHAIAPQTNTAATPVVVTTGVADGTGRKRMVYEDVVALLAEIGKTDCRIDGRRLVLCNDHWNDLLLDRKNFGDQLVNYKTGQIVQILGCEIYPYVACPIFTPAGAKVPYGAVVPVGAKQASVFFQKDNIGKKTGITKQYFVKSENNPRGQANELNYRHYFVAMPLLNTYIGAIVSGV